MKAGELNRSMQIKKERLCSIKHRCLFLFSYGHAKMEAVTPNGGKLG
jgi:hypothetical protein